jgi:hypothetical protein
MNRPEPSEYDPYFEVYISRVPEAEILTPLKNQPTELRQMLADVSDDLGTFRYEDGKWSLKELLSHVIDGERMFAYRVLRIARGDKTPIEGFDQDIYIESSHADERPFAELFDEFELLRRANLLLFQNLDDMDWGRSGTANGVSVSTRALAWIMVGHVRHHMAILRERYLSNFAA